LEPSVSSVRPPEAVIVVETPIPKTSNPVVIDALRLVSFVKELLMEVVVPSIVESPYVTLLWAPGGA
jgi:hypothetical protein